MNQKLMFKHIAIIPARKNSKGVKFKNRLLFNKTIKFIKKIKWIKKIIVSSDDGYIQKLSKKNNTVFLKREKKLSHGNVSIKKVIVDVIKKNNLNDNDILWLFYIPILGRQSKYYNLNKKVIEKKTVDSICSFFPVKTHPFNVWRYKNKKMNKLIKNDIYRRQDLPELWEHHHLICAFKVKEIYNLNSELINSRTRPIFLDKNLRENIIEIDTLEDIRKLNDKRFKK